jgi:hypothetical protein
MTTFHRQNLSTHIFETAGDMQWHSNSNVNVTFGVDQVARFRRKTANSLLILPGQYSGSQKTKEVEQPVSSTLLLEEDTITRVTHSSRRFKAGGSEYKWKVADNGNDLFVRSLMFPLLVAHVVTVR